jgi:Lon protease-like protein
MSKTPRSLKNFSGQARLFPLPNLILFPEASLPLHIFEPRYRKLLADALASDRLIAMAMLLPGWEQNKDGVPCIHPIVCLGRVEEEERLPDGRYNLLLDGIRRARILEEMKTDLPYRIARVELLEDQPVPSKKREQMLYEQLAETILSIFTRRPEAIDSLKELFELNLPLGTLCDIFSFSMPVPMTERLRLLEELRVEQRAELLLDSLAYLVPPDEEPEPPQRRFPTGFSDN